MKKLILAAFVCLALSVSVAAAPPSKTPPTITTSCSVCALGENIIYSGSGFKRGASVYLSVEGPVSRSINVTIDSTGGFHVDFGGMLDYTSGVYTANAYAKSGKKFALVASTAFCVGSCTP